MITRYYATKESYGFTNIFTDPTGTRMCLGSDPTDIHEIEIVETEDGPYWGWVPNGSDTYHFVYINEHQLRICFTYGIDAAIKRGDGRMVRLNVLDKGVHLKGARY